MPHYPKPFFRKARGCWYIQLQGKQYRLKAESQEAAWEEAAELKKKLRLQVVVTSEALVALIDAFLEWTQQRRSPETYEWYRSRLELFARRYPHLRTDDLTPQHVDQWIDGYPHLSPGSKRNYIRAIQRVMNWAVKQRLVQSSPIAHMEKPRAGRREQVVSRPQFEEILKLTPCVEFRDLLIVSWETGCRPQESLVIEARHVDLLNRRWLFSASEAKTDFPRLVYLTDQALEITKRRMAQFPMGPIFRNSRGKPWTTDAVNNAFCRIQIRMGKRLMRERGILVTNEDVRALAAKLRRTKMARGVATEKTAAELREEARRKLTNHKATALAPKYSLYSFRHTWATRALERGLDGLTVAILMGHQDPSTLAKVYQHLSFNPRHLLKEAQRAAAT